MLDYIKTNSSAKWLFIIAAMGIAYYLYRKSKAQKSE